MNSRSNYAVPIVAAALLVVPMLYVGSYYAVVDTDHPNAVGISQRAPSRDLRYRVYPEFAGRVYWPIEQVDRRLRPEAWDDPFNKLVYLITTTIVPESTFTDNISCDTGEASASAP